MPAPTKTTAPAATSAKSKSAGRFITVAEGRKITLAAKGWKGTPYAPQQKDGKLVAGSEKYAGGNPVKGKNGGADCSGSVWAIYKEAGFSYGHYFNSVAFVNLVATDTHFIIAWFKDLAGTEANFVQGKHFFKQVSHPQAGDIGWWHNGKSGHMVIYDNDAGTTEPNKQQGNVWSASNPSGRAFGPGRIDWYDKQYNAPAKWYRYWKAS